MITSEQVRAARALLRWEQKDLSEAAGVPLPTLKRLETMPGTLAAHGRTIGQIETAFQKAGIEFISPDSISASGGAGIRMRGRV